MIGALLALAVATSVGSTQQAEPPRLIVVVSVDQMRADYITRYRSQLVDALRRLTHEGAVFTDAHQDHAVTHTAPGHASISTGVFPSRSGIVANEWWDRKANRRIYAVEDSDAAIVGHNAAPGRSPANLLQDALGDWLKRASPSSKVFSVGIKDRSAILMGGKSPDGVYWYDYDTGRLITSTYYRADYPEWVAAFNDSSLVNSYFAGGWQRLLPADAYYLSREDAFAAEADGVQTQFPHAFNGGAVSASYYRRLPYSPFGDQLIFEFAKKLITEEEVGADQVADLLFIAASAADYIGHDYGPFSHEAQDYYLRLDRMLGDFMRFLDGQVGAGNYTLVLTGDHGVLPMPEELARRGVKSRRVHTSELQNAIAPALRQAMSDAAISVQPSIQFVGGFVLYFPGTDMPPEKLRTMRGGFASSLAKAAFARDVFTYDELLAGEGSRPFFELFRRSFHADRAPDVTMLMHEYDLLSSASRGTSHGSAYPYDTHVPLIFWGPGIPAGTYDARVRSVDIAPTVSNLLGIVVPAGLDGRSLMWALKNKGEDRY